MKIPTEIQENIMFQKIEILLKFYVDLLTQSIIVWFICNLEYKKFENNDQTF
jgi:hypothetical protein